MTPQKDLPLINLTLDLTSSTRFIQVYELGLGRGSVYVQTEKTAQLWQPVCLLVDLPDGANVLLTGSVVFFGTDGLGLALDGFDEPARRTLLKALSMARDASPTSQDVAPKTAVAPAGHARRHPRVPYSGDVRLRIGEHVIQAAGRDLSRSGVGVISSCRLETGRALDVMVELPDGESAHAEAHVVWGGVDGEPGLWNLGLAFQRLTIASKQHLSRFVEAAMAPA